MRRDLFFSNYNKKKRVWGYYFLCRTADIIAYIKPTDNPNAKGIHTPKLSPET